jgi:hypothetical protein
VIWTVAIVVVSAFALWRGGTIERVVAVANLAAWFGTMLVQDRTHWFDPQWSVLAVDVLFLLVLTGLALRTDRTWLLFAAAFQLLGVVTHFAIAVDGGFRARTYLLGLVIWSYLVLTSIAVGAWQSAVERGPRVVRS